MSDANSTGSDSRLDALLAETGLPQWATDLLLIVGFVVATYVGFAILGVLTGVSTNEIVGTLETITFFAAVYALVALALNLHWGYTGLFNIGVAGFMAVGAYTMAILTASPDASPAGLGLPIWVGVIGGTVAAALVGLVAGLPALRVRADYFAIVTLGFSEIIRLALLSGSLRSVEIAGTEYGTGGGSGIRYDPVDSVVPWLLDLEMPVLDWAFGQLFAAAEIVGIQPSIVQSALYTAILIAFVIAFYVFLVRVANSPFGRLLKAIREDELATRSLGKNTARVKLVVFMVGCALMGLAGILWMGSRSIVTPDSFMPIITFYVFVALIVGGSGSNTGSILGGFAFAAFLYEGPRFIRAIVRANADTRSPATVYDAFVAIGSGDVMPMVGYVVGSLDEIRFILVGVVLVVLMLWKPDGLLGHRTEIAAATDLSRRPRTTDGATATDGGEDDE